LNKADTKYIQQVAGTLLYYGQVVDTTIIPALSYGANNAKSEIAVRLLRITRRGNLRLQCE
jgi:hypothetical protein